MGQVEMAPAKSNVRGGITQDVNSQLKCRYKGSMLVFN